NRHNSSVGEDNRRINEIPVEESRPMDTVGTGRAAALGVHREPCETRQRERDHSIEDRPTEDALLCALERDQQPGYALRVALRIRVPRRDELDRDVVESVDAAELMEEPCREEVRLVLGIGSGDEHREVLL